MTKTINNPCRLCKRVSSLQESHIIPSFVGKWLKKTSATGFFSQISPDHNIQRVQDLFKTGLLCSRCEILISNFERYFAEKVFYPLQEGNLKSISINDNLGKFAVSISLKALWVLLEVKDSLALKWKGKLLELEEEWRNYLIETSWFTRGKNSHHIIFHSKSLMALGLPNNPNLIFNLMRSTAFYIYEKFNKAYISSNMAGIQIISMIEPAELPVSRGTQVYPEQKLGQERPGIGWGGYFQNLMEFSRDCNLASNNLREGQKKIINRAISKNPDRVRSSEDFKILAEQELFLRGGSKRSKKENKEE